MIPFYRPTYNHRELFAALRPTATRQQFEAAVAQAAKVDYGLSFAYGRVGLIAALRALAITDADVILPAYTCLVMAHAVVASGNRPVFVDINLSDYTMDIAALQRALTPRTRAVVAIPMYGYPINVDAIRSVVGEDVLIVEDCALAPQVLLPESAGLRGDVGLFSFGGGKPLSAYGGGVLAVRSAELYEKIKHYCDQTLRPASRKTHLRYWLHFLSSYIVFQEWMYGLLYRPKSAEALAYKFSLPPDYMPRDAYTILSEFQARIGLAQLGKLAPMLSRRRALARLYDHHLADLPGIYRPPIVEGASFTYYTVRIPRYEERSFEQCMAKHGVAIDRSYHYALPYLDAYRAFAHDEYPHAVQAAQEVINLPCFPSLQDAQVEFVSTCVHQCISNPPKL